MVGCDAPYWTSFSGLTWCLFSFTQWHLLILPKTQAFPQLSIGTAHGSWRSLWWFCCRILCIHDQPCRISPKKKKKIQIWKHFHQPTMVSWECRNRKKKNHRRGGFPRPKTQHPDSSNGISNDRILRIQNVKARTLQSKSAPQKKCWSYHDFSMVVAMPFTCVLYIRRLCHDICVFWRALYKPFQLPGGLNPFPCTNTLEPNLHLPSPPGIREAVICHWLQKHP